MIIERLEMLGVYNYTVILTYLGMFSSFLGMNFVFNGNLKAALLCLMISGVMDMFDGKVASTKKNRTDFEKMFGIQIDSLADLICYGVLAALIVMHFSVDKETTSTITKIAVVGICGLYVLCALIRLSYFNVDEAQRQSNTTECRHEYKGLPVTSAAIILPALYIVLSRINQITGIWASLLLAVMGLAFISPFKITKPHAFGKCVLIIFGVAELVFFVLM